MVPDPFFSFLQFLYCQVLPVLTSLPVLRVFYAQEISPFTFLNCLSMDGLLHDIV